MPALPSPVDKSWLLRLLAIEFPRLRPGGDCTLHLLLTLSDLFIIALCTNPPIPLVGEIGRSSLSGEIRPWDGDIASDLLDSPDLPSELAINWEPGGSNLWALDCGNGDPMLPENRFVSVKFAPLPVFDESLLEGVEERSVPAELLNLDIPGI